MGDKCAPLKTVPYQTEDPFPRVTSPITAALGATKAPSPMLAVLDPKLIIVRCLYTACIKVDTKSLRLPFNCQ